MISRLHNDEYFTPIKAESDVKKVYFLSSISDSAWMPLIGEAS